MAKKSGLGRGLDALFSEAPPTSAPRMELPNARGDTIEYGVAQYEGNGRQEVDRRRHQNAAAGDARIRQPTPWIGVGCGKARVLAHVVSVGKTHLTDRTNGSAPLVNRNRYLS